MIKRIWNHSFGYFNGKTFWEEFSRCFGTSMGLLALFVLPLLVMIQWVFK